MQILIGFLAVILFGYILATFFLPKSHPFEKLAVGYLLGWGIFTLSTFLLTTIGINITAQNLSLILLGLIFLSKVFVGYKNLIYIPKNKKPWDTEEKILGGIIFLIFLIVTINGLYQVVHTWDALTLYDFRAKRILETGSIAKAAKLQGGYFFGYPLFTSLSHTWLYALGAKSPMIFYASIFISLITAFYYQIKQKTENRKSALFTSLLLILAPHIFWHSQIAYTNLPYTAFYSLGAILLVSWAKTNKFKELLLGSLLTGLSVWVRSVEPFWLASILFLAVVGVWKKRFWQLLSGSALFLVFERAWKVASAQLKGGSPSSPIKQIISVFKNISSNIIQNQDLSLIASSLDFFLTNAIKPYIPVLILFSLTLIWKLYSKSKDWLMEVLITANYVIAFFGVFQFAISISYWQDIPDSLNRMMVFISPLILYSFSSLFKKSQ